MHTKVNIIRLVTDDDGDLYIEWNVCIVVVVVVVTLSCYFVYSFSKVVDDVIISQRQFEFVLLVFRLLLFGPYLDALHITHVHSSLAQTHTHTRLDSLVCTTAHLSFFFFLICIFLLFFLVELWVSLTVCISRASVIATEFHDNGNPRLSTPATSARSTRRQLMVAFISPIEQIQRFDLCFNFFDFCGIFSF